MTKIMIWLAELGSIIFMMLCGYCVAKGDGIAVLLSVITSWSLDILKKTLEEYLQKKQKSLN